MLTQQVTFLPEREEIIQRLRSVRDDPDLVENFYRLVANWRGDRDIGAFEIAILFRRAIEEYAERKRIASTSSQLWIFVPRFIDAIVDDEEVAELAKKIFQRWRIGSVTLVTSAR